MPENKHDLKKLLPNLFILILGGYLFYETNKIIYLFGAIIASILISLPKVIKRRIQKIDQVQGVSAETKAKVKKNIWATSLLTGGMVVGGVLLFYFMTGSHVEGSIDATGGKLGAWVLKPDHCASGQTKGFFGVELDAKEDDQHGVPLIKDPINGSMIIVYAQETGPEGMKYRRADCQVFDLDLVQTGNRFNDVREMRGSAQFDCESIRGKVKFSKCFF